MSPPWYSKSMNTPTQPQSTRQPIGADAVIVFDGDEENVYISFGDFVEDYAPNGECADSYGVPDMDIFFFGSPEEEDNYRKGTEGWTLISWEMVYGAEASDRK